VRSGDGAWPAPQVVALHALSADPSATGWSRSIVSRAGRPASGPAPAPARPPPGLGAAGEAQSQHAHP